MRTPAQNRRWIIDAECASLGMQLQRSESVLLQQKQKRYKYEEMRICVLAETRLKMVFVTSNRVLGMEFVSIIIIRFFTHPQSDFVGAGWVPHHLRWWTARLSPCFILYKLFFVQASACLFSSFRAGIRLGRFIQACSLLGLATNLLPMKTRNTSLIYYPSVISS